MGNEVIDAINEWHTINRFDDGRRGSAFYYAREMQRSPEPDDDRERPTTRPPSRPTTTLTIYRLNAGGWSFSETSHCLAVEAGMVTGCHVSEAGGELFLFRAPGTPGLSAADAIKARLVQIPVFQKEK